MPSLTTLAAIGAAGLVIYALARAGLSAVQQGGRDAERAKSARAELEIERREGAVMAEQRSVDDAQQRLDRGSF